MTRTKKALTAIGMLLVAAVPGGIPLLAGIYAIRKYRTRKDIHEDPPKAV